MVVVAAGCSGRPQPTKAVDHVIAAEPQRAGDPQRGWQALISEGYVGCGVPRGLWQTLGWNVPEAMRLSRSRGGDLPYFMNSFTAPSGVELVTANCLGCHAAFLRGKLVIGLGEASNDFTIDASSELAVAGLLLPEPARSEHTKLTQRVRALARAVSRTVGANPADHIAAVLFAHRDPRSLAWSDEPKIAIPDDEPIIPVDVPAWWLLKKKTAMFHTGAGRGDHARIMMTASVLCVDDVATARAIDSYFPDVRAFILSLSPPPFPGAIDGAAVARGERVFERSCSRCHGMGDRYITRIIPLATVKTDPLLARHAQFAAPFIEWFNRSFYGERSRLEPGDGYVAPPLDGVWATAPYLHNGSIPNLAALLDSTKRLPRTAIIRGAHSYDLDQVGWPNVAPDAATESKFVYDRALPGYSNGGHMFGDDLTTAERAAVLEYLKTL